MVHDECERDIDRISEKKNSCFSISLP